LGPGVAWGHEVNKSAVVLLVSHNQAGERISTGTGFVVSPNGTLITNYHVLVDAVDVVAVFQDGTRVHVQSVQALDRLKDFSILQLEEGVYSTLELGFSAPLKGYDYVSALGYPVQGVQGEKEDLKGSLMQTYGYVLGIHPQADPGFRFIYTTAPFGPGFSGGPVINKKNQVVGLATLEGRAINLALPIDEVKPHLNTHQGKTLAQLLEEDKTSKEALYYRGNFALYGEGDVEKAIQLFRQSLEIDPNFVLAHYDLAVAYRGLGEVEKAIAEYEKALKINPDFPEALSNLGGQYFRQGDIEKAVTYFKKAVKAYPNFIQALSNLGAALNKQGRAKEALPHIKQALSLDPEFGVAYFNMGNALFQLDHLEEAEKAYNTAVTMGIDFLSLHWKLHKIYLKQNLRNEAMAELKIILQMDPENEAARKKFQEMLSGKTP